MMDDELLERIGRFAREEDAEDKRRFGERLRRLSAGELSDEEEAALRAEAERSPEAFLDYEAFRPLGEDFHARTVREWQAQTGAGDRAAGGTPSGETAPVVPFERRRTPLPRLRTVLAWAAVAALAVVGLYRLRGPAGPAFVLPTYAALLEGELRSTRSPDAGDALGEDGLPTFEMGGRFRLLLRPEREVDADPQIAFYLAAGTGSETAEPRRWNVGYERSAQGVVTIAGVLGDDLEITPGDWTFVFLYGRPGSLPEPAALADLEPPGSDWDSVRVAFRVLPGESAAGGLRLDVEYAGCYAVSRGSACTPYSELTLWVRSVPGARLDVRVGGRLVGEPGVAVDGGRRFVVPVTVDDGQVDVVASWAGDEARFELALMRLDEPAWFRDARRLAYDGDRPGALELLEGHLEDAPPEARGPALSLLARLAGDEDERLRLLEEAVVLHRRHGRLLELVNDLGNLSRADVGARRFGRLRRRLEELAAALPPAAPGEALVALHYYRTILARDLGDYRSALRSLESTAALARRLGLAAEQAKAQNGLGLVLQGLGRSTEAAEQFRQLDLSALSACDQAHVLNNRAWVAILAAGVPNGGRPADDPLPLLAEALEIARRGSCGESLSIDLLLNRALALEGRGQRFEALAALTEAETLGASATPLHRLWWSDLEGRLALADGRGHDALASYLRMEELAGDAFDPGGRWWARVGQARAHQALGDPGAALAAFAQAEVLVDSQSLEVPLDAGRERFAAQREEGARRHLELLLSEGRTAEALAVARRSRARVLRALQRGHRLSRLSAQEQATWDLEIAAYLALRSKIEDAAAGDAQLSEDRLAAARVRRAEDREEAQRRLDRAFRVFEGTVPGTALPPLAEGELVLAYHPLVTGWAGFAASASAIRALRFSLDGDAPSRPEELSRLLLEPFRQEISAAGKIRVLAYGELRAVDFHALPWQGDVLLAARPVVYGLDLGRPAADGTPPAAALVVADPRGDLKAARHEAAAVWEALRAGNGREVVRLEGPAAVAAEVRHAASGVGLLHYAGHGISAGRFGWESALLLAGDTQLVPGDVLALGRAPARVVLSACESARDAATPVAGLGLAQAFLVAGSERVIAALRPVGDAETAALFRGLYSTWDGREDLAAAFRRAQLDWRRSAPATDWASFRVLEP